MKTIRGPGEGLRGASTAFAAVNILLRASGLGIGSWIGYQLIRQNGQILVRLDALQERIDALDHQPAAQAQSQGLPIGTEAPEFELRDLNGGSFSLTSRRGTPLLLIFFDPNCGFCRSMAPDLATLPVSEARGQPVPVVVSTGKADENRTLMRENGIQCPVLLQEEREVFTAYGVMGTPSGCLVDEHGHIASELSLGAPATLALSKKDEDLSEPINGSAVVARGAQRSIRPVTDSHLLRTGLPPGTPAPSFRLTRLDGEEAVLDEYRGRPLLLVFSDPNCGPCNEVAPQLERLHRSQSELQILMISRGDTASNEKKVREHGLTFPVALQRHWEMSRAYGMFATPIAYLIDDHGFIATDVAVGPDSIMALATGATSPRGDPARA